MIKKLIAVSALALALSGITEAQLTDCADNVLNTWQYLDRYSMRSSDYYKTTLKAINKITLRKPEYKRCERNQVFTPNCRSFEITCPLILHKLTLQSQLQYNKQSEWTSRVCDDNGEYTVGTGEGYTFRCY